jgi:hypothetical protein
VRDAAQQFLEGGMAAQVPEQLTNGWMKQAIYGSARSRARIASTIPLVE